MLQSSPYLPHPGPSIGFWPMAVSASWESVGFVPGIPSPFLLITAPPFPWRTPPLPLPGVLAIRGSHDSGEANQSSSCPGLAQGVDM